MKAQFTIFNVVGARPNMMKMAPIVAEMRRHAELRPLLVHTGQHYDFAMSDVFLEQLKLGEPDFNLQVGSGTHHAQTAQIMKSFGELVRTNRPDMIVVAGDVNSTMACALVGAKERIPVAHVEAGLRSFDRSMPEEINRVVTDAVSDLLLTTELSAGENLAREGVPAYKIFFTGNVMIDSLVAALETARRSSILSQLGVKPGKYALLTLHRPSNVDDQKEFLATLRAIQEIARELPVLFPVHPRTASRVANLRLDRTRAWDQTTPIGAHGIWTMPPAPYLDFLCLMDSAAIVITDSGGIQEETTYLGVPCLTYRDNTERPVTVTHGTNRLVGAKPENLIAEAKLALCEARDCRRQQPPQLWDGRAAQRIVGHVRAYLQTLTTVSAKEALRS
jgi:UDP-N-acetylglucosamine 2-epimerase (non-hydrolysing)